MLLTISTTMADATALGFLLHKHPGRVQSFDLAVGVAHVFYPEVSAERTTAALLLEVDPVALVRGHRDGPSSGGGFSLGQYVNDRPYAASSMLAAAVKQVFGTALSGRSASHQELADTAIPLEIHLPALPCRGGAELLRELFEPLGWTVDATPVPLDPELGWGDSRYLDTRLTGTLRLAGALNHLYVLLPVLDNSKHYWIAGDEVDKLLRAGDGWLAGHPRKAWIARRYLAHRHQLTGDALARLAESETPDDVDAPTADEVLTEDAAAAPAGGAPAAGDAASEGRVPAAGAAASAGDASAAGDAASAGPRPVPLHVLRRQAVVAAVREAGATSVADLGCGEGALVRDLLDLSPVQRIVATDVSARALQIAARKLRLDRMPERRRRRLDIFQSSVTYRDARIAGLDAAVLMEVIEHVDPARLPALERSVFAHAAPSRVVVTTPNVEHNVRYEFLEAGVHRHRDHRFEWTRAEFRGWADDVAAAHGYTVEIRPVGPDDAEVGPPTQMAVFDKRTEDAAAAADAHTENEEVPA
ncbi:3' terminal RNA ribose 2'-O-methyltransferase Hen1 [Myceligenerans crystallogenes]|uniref:Small RNA 2'-O-methyltransferase n=1 Tax=Myceligenerans crystallogenes TaxID=316335 RepID=A0ABP4ZXE0_9MICO